MASRVFCAIVFSRLILACFAMGQGEKVDCGANVEINHGYN